MSTDNVFLSTLGASAAFACLLGPRLADACWHLPELTWNNSSGLSEPVQLLITKDDGREEEGG